MTLPATTVILVRHAAHDALSRVLCGRAPGIGLSDDGRQQAARLAERLAEVRPSAIYTSPIERARETAMILADRLDLVPIPDDRLTEIDFGAWTGRSFEALADDPRWSRWNAVRSAARAPAGETMIEVQRRATAALASFGAAHPGERIAAVSHGDVIKAALMHALAMPLDAHALLEISPGSMSAVALWPGGGKVLSMNEFAA